jgi:hypothetical protein
MQFERLLVSKKDLKAIGIPNAMVVFHHHLR